MLLSENRSWASRDSVHLMNNREELADRTIHRPSLR